MRNKTSSDLDLDALERDGFLVIEDVLDARALARINEAIPILHERAKQDPLWRTGGTLHLEGLLDIGDPFDAAWTESRLVRAVTSMLGDEYRVARADVRSPLPGEGAQALHADYPARPPDGHAVATAIVAITGFTEKNGATRVVPASHREPHGSVPKDHDTPFPGQRIITMPAGSALIFSGHLLHSGTRNRSKMRRDALQVTFARPGARLFA